MSLHNALRDKVSSALHDQAEPLGVSGANAFQSRSYAAASVDTNTCTFQISPPAGTLMDRRVILEFPVVIAHAAAGTALEFQPCFAPRQYAGMNCIRQISVDINGTSIQSRPQNDLVALKRYDINGDRLIDESMFLSAPDPDDPLGYCPLYATPAAANHAAWLTNIDGASYHDRAGAPYTINDHSVSTHGNRASSVHYVDYGAGTADIRRVYTFRCPLFLNDLLDFEAGRSLAHVNQFNVTISWDSRMFTNFVTSPAVGAGAAGVFGQGLVNIHGGNLATIEVTAAMVSVGDRLNAPAAATFKLLIGYTTPVVEIPKELSYEYTRYDRFVTQVGQIAANTTSGTVTSSDVTLPQVPDAIYLFVRGNQSERAQADGDVFMRFMELDIRCNGTTTSYNSPAALRELCLENHMFSKSGKEYVGVVKLLMGKDIPMPQSPQGPSVVGQPLSVSLSFTCKVHNWLTTVKNNLELHVLVAYPSKLTLSQQNATIMQGLTPAEVEGLLAMPASSMVPESAHTQVVGGKLRLGKITKWISKNFNQKKLHSAIQSVEKVLGKVDDFVEKGVDFADKAKNAVDAFSPQNAAAFSGGQVIGGQVIGGKMTPHRYYLK
jgi:hypothetical protein